MGSDTNKGPRRASSTPLMLAFLAAALGGYLLFSLAFDSGSQAEPVLSAGGTLASPLASAQSARTAAAAAATAATAIGCTAMPPRGARRSPTPSLPLLLPLLLSPLLPFYANTSHIHRGPAQA